MCYILPAIEKNDNLSRIRSTGTKPREWWDCHDVKPPPAIWAQLSSFQSDIYFVGGFGTVAWVDVKEYAAAQPDLIAANGAEETLQELNGRFSKQLKKLLAAASEEQSQGKVSVDDAALISINSQGVDIRVRQGAQFDVQRMAFDGGQSVDTLDHAVAALHHLVERGAKSL